MNRTRHFSELFRELLPRRGQGRLARHTIVIAFLLIAGGLVTSSLSSLYLRYHEIQAEQSLFLSEVTARAP